MIKVLLVEDNRDISKRITTQNNVNIPTMLFAKHSKSIINPA